MWQKQFKPGLPSIYTIMNKCGMNIECLVDSLNKAIAKLPETTEDVRAIIELLPERALRDALNNMAGNEQFRKLCQMNPPPIKAISSIRPAVVSDAEIAQCIALKLLDAGIYKEAISFINRANELYHDSTNLEYLRALLDIAMAGELVNRSQRLHLDGDHEAEKIDTIEAAKHYLNAAYIYDQLDEAEHAELTRFNAIDVMAQYYLIHGNLDDALAQYNRCVASSKSDYVILQCKSMKLFLEAIMEEDADKYVEAGDQLISANMPQYALMAYGAAYQLSNKPMIYVKYIGALVNHVDSEVRNRYSSFEEFIDEINKIGLRGMAEVLNVNEDALLKYLEMNALLRSTNNPEIVIKYLANDEDAKRIVKNAMEELLGYKWQSSI